MTANDLTDADIELLRELPADTDELAEQLDCARGTVYSRIAAIRERAGDDAVITDDDGTYRVGDVDLVNETDDEDDDEQDDGDGLENLDEQEEYLIDQVLPATTQEIADELQVPKRVAETYAENLTERCGAIIYDDDAGMWEVADPDVKMKIGSKHQSTITRTINNWFSANEDEMKKLREEMDGRVVAPQSPVNGNEDVVGVLSDIHIGQEVTDHNGQVIFGEKHWRASIREFKTKAISIPSRMVSEDIDFDTFHLVLNGDIVTNENIYDGQWQDLGKLVRGQINMAIDELVYLIRDISQYYDAVNVICQVGNHGEMRASGQSKEANADLFVYDGLERAVYWSHDMNNVNFQIGKATPYKLFNLRGGKHTAFATHGEAAYEQITGTAASDSQMTNWMVGLEEKPDIMYLAHLHEFRDAPVNGIRAIRTPSPKPGGVHEFELGALRDRDATTKIGYLHGVSDDRVRTWGAVVDAVDSTVLGDGPVVEDDWADDESGWIPAGGNQ